MRFQSMSTETGIDARSLDAARKPWPTQLESGHQYRNGNLAVSQM